MESIYAGWLSLIPPMLAIGLALLTKEVLSSLTIGILAGAYLYSAALYDGLGNQLIGTAETVLGLMADKIGSNADILLFLAMLGALVVNITKAGGSRAYGNWAVTKIQTSRGAKLATCSLGALILMDDYFNCLTVGTVMRPVTERYQISPAKLAYLIDATAAPVCILAPISSWAASVISQTNGAGLDGMSIFLQAIPYNLYAILTLIMVVLFCITDLEYGPMRRFEQAHRMDHITSMGMGHKMEQSAPHDTSEKSEKNAEDHASQDVTAEERNHLKISERGTIWDLVIPLVLLVALSILTMLYLGGYFEGNRTIAEGFGNTDAGRALAVSSFVTLVFTCFFFVGRKVVSFHEYMAGITEGLKSMAGAFTILVLAWTISGICSDLLETGAFVRDLVADSNLIPQLIPLLVFVAAGALSFAMGTSWGTFGILIPIAASICQELAPQLTIISISAVLAGSVFGDHCSPISDTTILSSTGAQCSHIDHVSSQIPYALTAAAASGAGYLVAGITHNLLLTWMIALLVLFGMVYLLSIRSQVALQKKEGKGKK